MDWVIEFSEQVLDSAAARVRELAPDLGCTLTSTMGHPAHALAVASADADAVVVGRRGLGGAASALLGFGEQQADGAGEMPPVVVGEGEFPMTGLIVMGVDGSEFCTNALRYAIAEAAVRMTSVRAVAAYDVLHPAFRADPELVARMRADVEAEAAETITRALDQAKGTAPAAVSVAHLAVEGRPAEAIRGDSEDTQLIVVGTHGKGLVRRVLLVTGGAAFFFALGGGVATRGEATPAGGCPAARPRGQSGA